MHRMGRSRAKYFLEQLCWKFQVIRYIKKEIIMLNCCSVLLLLCCCYTFSSAHRRCLFCKLLFISQFSQNIYLAVLVASHCHVLQALQDIQIFNLN